MSRNYAKELQLLLRGVSGAAICDLGCRSDRGGHQPTRNRTLANSKSVYLSRSLELRRLNSGPNGGEYAGGQFET